MYIENLASLNTRILNSVTRGIINDFTDLYDSNSMILSSIVTVKNNTKQSYINLIKYW